MDEETLDNLGELQRAVLEAVWGMGEATVQQVRDRVAEAGRGELAYTTVLSVMQKLEKAGWLGHRAEGRVYVYKPTRSRDEADSSTARALLRRVFGGDPLRLFQHLIADEDLSDGDLAAIRKMLERKKSERKG
ncbi:Transcriptional regulator BlaI [Aquisphaera giovannonii]|uniref:Transcriptional regulator BlaI n=1 Tax=Aquisphaera giovannonii TaxID=406548 RepID=A0A5B9VW76_9BACT|nr:BlaI/MecI/CopY family transcriptional regulator [Aquisphaera giovannonii]QEH32339.1 Transcriptional regulator BlaI [Aquisphaera giovannonii]